MSGIASLLAIFAAVTVFVFAQQSIVSFKQENMNKRLIGHLLYEVKATNIQPCIAECMFLGACESFNFNRRNETCELNNEGSQTVSLSDYVEENGTMFFDITDFQQMRTMVGGCAGHNCTNEQRCYPAGDGYFCSDLPKCGDPPAVQSGVFQGEGNTAGTIRNFKCHNGLGINGTKYITCLHNGSWTHFNAVCGFEYYIYSGTNQNYPNLFRSEPIADDLGVDKRTSITFQVKVNTGRPVPHIVLHHDMDVFDDEVIAVCLGRDNYFILVTQGNDLRARHEIQADDILSRDVYRWFWISWDEGCVKVGNGTTVDVDERLRWCGLQFTIRGIKLAAAFVGELYFRF